MYRFITILFMISLCWYAQAHETRPAYLLIEQTGETNYALTFRQPELGGRYLGLLVSSDCEPEGEMTHRLRSRSLESAWSVDCGQMSILDARVTIVGLDQTMIDTLVHLSLANGDQIDRVLTPREPVLLAEGEKGLSFLPGYFVLGVEHLLFGLDHVAFLIVLLYLIRRTSTLIIAITSFTIAHSITLGLAAFDIITVPQQPVEAVIALSIVIVALELTRRDGESVISRFPWSLTFVFGLLHGLGFAGAMAEIGLPPDSALVALLLFNIGIEVGQLMIIGVVLLANFAWRHVEPDIPTWVYRVPVYLIGGMSSFWLIDRTTGILFGA